jgi:hypothetical protein
MAAENIIEDPVFERMAKEKEEVIAHNNEILAQQIIPEAKPGTTFVSFSEDLMKDETAKYRDITVEESKDDHGRRFFRFSDGGATSSLILVLFQHGHRHLLSVNDKVIPFQDFLHIVDVESLAEYATEVASHDIRSGVAVSAGSVVVRVQLPATNVIFDNANRNKEYTFTNTTVPLLMMAMTHLSKVDFLNNSKDVGSREIRSSE